MDINLEQQVREALRCHCKACRGLGYSAPSPTAVARALEAVLDGVTDPDQHETRRYLVERFLAELTEAPDA